MAEHLAAEGAEEAAARARLSGKRRMANGLLVLAGGVFVGTHLIEAPGFWTGLVAAGAEAGLIGGVADWFAVTALFRHPLGLPIPHTAIVPRNQARIGRALGRFVERHFLTEEILRPKIRQARLGRRLGTWLGDPQNARLLAPPLAAGLVRMARALENRDLQALANRTIGRQLRQADVVPALAQVARAMMTSGQGDVLFERAIGVGLRWLRENRATVERLVSERSRWWIPRTLDRKIAALIVDNVLDVLGALREPGSVARRHFREALAGLVEEIERDPEQRARVNAFKDRILESSELQGWLGELWTRLSRERVAELREPGSETRVALERVVGLLGRAFASDPAMQRHVDLATERAALSLVEWRGEIGGFMQGVVQSWDSRTLTDRLELAVGPDLQYIRMNGTVVGAAVGCALYLLVRLVFG